jgi:ABC-type Fe3+/spermidine/putrescine transport system ATPase subunit
MNEGRIVELADPRSLYLRPKSRFAAQFVGQADLMDCTVIGSEGGRMIVDTPLGQLHATASSPDVPLSGRVSLLIRPEHIELRTGVAQSGNEVAGVIERLVFSGRIVEYFVRVGDRSVRVQGTSRTLFDAGEQVLMVLPVEHCVVVAG